MKTPQDVITELMKNSEIMLNECETTAGVNSEVFAQHIIESSVVFEGTDFSVSKSNTTSIYGIRTIVDGKLGFMTTNSNESSVLREIASETKQLASLSVPSEHHRIAEKTERMGYSENFDPALQTLSPADLYHYLQLVVDEAFKEKKIALDRAEISCVLQFWTMSNSNGFSQQAAATNCSWYAMGMGKTETEVTSFDYDGGCVWNKANLESEIIKTMARFRQSLTGSLSPRPAKDYKGAVLLHPVAVVDILGHAVEFNANGKNHVDGISSWKNQVGEQVASELLTIRETPLNKERPAGWNPFDREGISTANHEIIKEGRLNFIGHNCFSAHQSGTKPTGNASGDASSLPQIGFSNLVIEGVNNQEVSDAMIGRELGTGLVLKRFSGNSDPISGQFSGVVKNSWWLQNGERSHAVDETMVSGNLFETLQQIQAVGSNLHTTIGGAQAPYILIDGISVTGG